MTRRRSKNIPYLRHSTSKKIVKGKRKGDLLGHQTRLTQYGTSGKKIRGLQCPSCVTDEA